MKGDERDEQAGQQVAVLSNREMADSSSGGSANASRTAELASAIAIDRPGA